MKKIYINGSDFTPEDVIEHFTINGEIDGSLWYYFDTDTLAKAIGSFDRAYSAAEVIEKYLNIVEDDVNILEIDLIGEIGDDGQVHYFDR